MDEQTRRAIAYAAAEKVNGSRGGSIYSYGASRHTAMRGLGTNFYDHQSQAHISGSGSGLYHHGNQSHINLHVSGMNFSGYDYCSGHHYQGSVNGRRSEEHTSELP